MDICVNGVRLWYEKTGNGRPIVLLHGNGGSHAIFETITPQLAPNFTVYALDSRCHGKSGQAALGYGAMAEDTAAFIRALGLQKPLLYGFSDGGIVGLLLASRYPELLARMAVSGANAAPRGLCARELASVWRGWLSTRDPKLLLMLKEPHIRRAELARIRIPVLVLAGEHDLIRKKHTEWIAAGIPRSTLRILPGENHGSYVENSPKLYGVLHDFLEAESAPEGSPEGAV